MTPDMTNTLKHDVSGQLFFKIMMRTFVFLFCTAIFGLVPKHVLSQNNKIVIDVDKKIAINEVFSIIKKQTDYMFVYHQDLFTGIPKIKLKKGTIRLSKLLNMSIPSGTINVVFGANNTILLTSETKHIKQQLRVSGTVTEEATGLPLVGVTVYIKGTSKGVVSDLDGHYTITVPADPTHVLVFSSMGFETREITVSNQSTINISLKESVSTLDEVVINAGYYNTSERERTGSISKIAAKDIEKQPVSNPLAAMQGHLSGVQITQNTGVSGGNFRIRIRGSNFLDLLPNTGGPNIATERNNPLYIIDGVPYSSNTLTERDISANIHTNFGVSPLNTINPANIKSIEVLKDADATAIYGSRGANGVVLITTKKGRVGKTQIKANVTAGIGKVTRFDDLMNTEQYLDMRIEALKNDGYTLETILDTDENFEGNNPDLYAWDPNRYTNWQKVLLGGTAFRQSAQLSFSGGSESTQFLLSGMHSSTGNVFPGDLTYKNVSVHVSLNHKSKDARFKLSTSANYGSDTNDLPTQDLTNRAVTLAPNAPALYDDQGNLNWENGTWGNPLAFTKQAYNLASYSLIANTTLSFRPIPSLELKTNLGHTQNHLEAYTTNPRSGRDPNTTEGQDSSTSSISTNRGSDRSWIIEPQINWEHQWQDTRFKVLLGTTFQQNIKQQLYLNASNFPSDDLLHSLTAAETREIIVDTESQYKYHAVFGRLNINVKDKYIFNLTGRRDGSSRFGSGKQFGIFGAIGASWLFSEENFLKDHALLSFGKLRGSYGLTGSDNVGDYVFYDAYRSSGVTYNGSSLGPVRLFNPDLAWGTNIKQEIALELGFFKDRVFMTTAWYRNRSSNQLISVPLSLTTGFSNFDDNFDAVVQNMGVELDIRTKNIEGNAFKWNTTFNISANRNKLVSFPGLEDSPYASSLKIGKPIGIQQLYHFLGVNSETGLWEFEDYNNDGTIDGDDNQLVVDYTPKFTGGLGNIFSYKNLQLNVFFQFTKQNAVNHLRAGLLNLGNVNQNMPISILDRWQQPGDQSPIQRYFVINSEALNTTDRYVFSNAVISDASFIRLRSLSLAYQLPKEITKGLGVNVYFQGQNLFIITDYDGVDPEVPGARTLPPLRQFTLGLDVTF
ncbi:TonB-dependent receptor [Flavivirga jejuensis]